MNRLIKTLGVMAACTVFAGFAFGQSTVVPAVNPEGNVFTREMVAFDVPDSEVQP